MQTDPHIHPPPPPPKHTHAHTHTRMHTRTHACIHAHTHAHTHTHTHTQITYFKCNRHNFVTDSCHFICNNFHWMITGDYFSQKAVLNPPAPSPTSGAKRSYTVRARHTGPFPFPSPLNRHCSGVLVQLTPDDRPWSVKLRVENKSSVCYAVTLFNHNYLQKFIAKD